MQADIERLIAKWRDEARDNYGGCGSNTYVERCADELSALLAAPGGAEPPPQDTMADAAVGDKQAALKLLLPAIPHGTDWQANRYDTDDSMVLLFWRSSGPEPRSLQFDTASGAGAAGDEP